ncbi:MAG: hypothetical protein HZA91_06810 [Verrucomicrobia bacterium]|nr:hypothetical protein [Verrucomicrobiota bacterium]
MQKQFVIALTVLFAFAFGCGKSEKTYKTAEGEVKVKHKSGEVTYEATTKEGKFTMAAGDKGVALPADFPKDVPILKGATVKMAMTHGKQFHVQLQAPGAITDATKFYEEGLKGQGWEIETTMNMGDSTMLSAKKGGRQCAIVAAKDTGGTIVTLTVTPEGS